MAWIFVNEYLHRGFQLKLTKDGGWTFTLGDEEYHFPNLQDAKHCVDGLMESAVKDYGAKALPKE